MALDTDAELSAALLGQAFPVDTFADTEDYQHALGLARLVSDNVFLYLTQPDSSRVWVIGSDGRIWVIGSDDRIWNLTQDDRIYK